MNASVGKYILKISKNKELVVYDNGFHEMYCDFEKEEMFNKIISWIKKNKTVGKTDFRMNQFISSIPNRYYYRSSKTKCLQVQIRIHHQTYYLSPLHLYCI